MEWKLQRFDNAMNPPELSFSMHETKEEALQTVRDHPRDGRMTNRIEGPDGEVIDHEEIVQWCEKHPASIEQRQAPEKRLGGLKLNHGKVLESEAAFEPGPTEPVKTEPLFGDLTWKRSDERP